MSAVSTFLLCACGCGGTHHPVTPRTLYPPHRVKGPDVEPVTLAEAKLHVKVEHAADDSLITSLIGAARSYCEHHCEATWGEGSEWSLTVDGYPSAWPIPLLYGPVAAVESVALVDSLGASVAVTDAVVDLFSVPARLLPPVAGWPSPPGTAAWVRTQIAYSAGGAVPLDVRQVMLLLIAQWYDSRAAVRLGSIVASMPNAVEALLAPYRATCGVIA